MSGFMPEKGFVADNEISKPIHNNIEIRDPKNIEWLDKCMSTPITEEIIENAKSEDDIEITVNQIWQHTWKKKSILKDFPFLKKFKYKIINDSTCRITIKSLKDLLLILNEIGEIDMYLDLDNKINIDITN